jgi:hypothetical protein
LSRPTSEGPSGPPLGGVESESFCSRPVIDWGCILRLLAPLGFHIRRGFLPWASAQGSVVYEVASFLVAPCPSWALGSSPFRSWVLSQSRTALVASIEAGCTACPLSLVFLLRLGCIRLWSVPFRSNAFPMAILRLSALSPCLFLYFVCSPLYLPSGAVFCCVRVSFFSLFHYEGDSTRTFVSLVFACLGTCFCPCS